jgi:hypothetical protein
MSTVIVRNRSNAVLQISMLSNVAERLTASTAWTLLVRPFCTHYERSVYKYSYARVALIYMPRVLNAIGFFFLLLFSIIVPEKKKKPDDFRGRRVRVRSESGEKIETPPCCSARACAPYGRREEKKKKRSLHPRAVGGPQR